jgi:hypothetical protein
MHPQQSKHANVALQWCATTKYACFGGVLAPIQPRYFSLPSLRIPNSSHANISK